MLAREARIHIKGKRFFTSDVQAPVGFQQRPLPRQWPLQGLPTAGQIHSRRAIEQPEGARNLQFARGSFKRDTACADRQHALREAAGDIERNGYWAELRKLRFTVNGAVPITCRKRNGCVTNTEGGILHPRRERKV